MNKIIEGTLDGKIAFYMRELFKKDEQLIFTLQDEAASVMNEPSMLANLTAEEFDSIIEQEGSVVIGTFVNEELIGFRALLVPEIEDEEHLGYDIGLSYEQLHEVVYQEITCVSPRFRGYRLQQKMAQVIMDYADLQNFTYVCATVAPFNIPSLKDKLVQGMEIVALGLKYGGKLRYTFAREIIPTSKSYTEEQQIAMDDIALQQKVCKEGWRGTGILLQDEKWFVHFEK